MFPGRAQRIHWSFPDPAIMGTKDEERLLAFQQVRNDLEAQLKQWLVTLPTAAKRE
jgi:arsenate reductase (thioredoxin)